MGLARRGLGGCNCDSVTACGCASVPTTLELTSTLHGAFTLTYNGSTSWDGPPFSYTSPPCAHFSCPGAMTTAFFRLLQATCELSLVYEAQETPPGFFLCAGSDFLAEEAYIHKVVSCTPFNFTADTDTTPIPSPLTCASIDYATITP